MAMLLAVLLSPIIAVGVSMWIQGRQEKRRTKLWVFNTLIATRHSPLVDENVRALNMIDVVFYNASSVRRLWHEYFEMLCNNGLSNQVGWGQRQKKNLELIAEMAKVLGYGKAISALDVDRVYYPTGLMDANRKSQELTEELLRVLRGTHRLDVTPRPGDVASELPRLEPPKSE